MPIMKNSKRVGFIYHTALPEEYQEVEYIESDGNQYINLNFVPTSNTDFEIKLATTEPNPTVIRRIMGGYTNTSARYELALSYTSNGMFINYYSSSVFSSYIPTINEAFVVSKKGNKFITPNGSFAIADNEFNSNTTAYLFATNRSSTSNFIGRIYYLKIYNGSTTSNYLIPCYRKSDDVIGMYDIITKTFFTNQGTGSFTKGNDTVTGNIDKVYHGEDLVFTQGFIREQVGVPPLTTDYPAIGKDLLSYRIYGNTIQNGTPAPTAPIAIQSLGDLVTDSSDPNYGKYKIAVIITDGRFSTTTNIYLNAPLRKITDRDTEYADYIDFSTGKVYRRIGEYVFDSTHYSFNAVTSSNIRYFYRVISDVAFPVVAPFVTHYEGVRSFYSGMGNLRATVNGGVYRSLYVRDDNYSTTTDFSNFIKSLADNGNPMKMNYVLPASFYREETVTLPSIPSYKAITTYSFGTDVNASSIWIQYRGK